MPLRCTDANGKDVQAFDLNDDEWVALKIENKKSLDLGMPCCNAGMILKTSSRGMHFFAHKKKGECMAAPESEQHLSLKGLAVMAARANGWEAATEVNGETPVGE